MKRLHKFLPVPFLLLLGAAPAVAQYELKAGNFNSTFVPQTAAGAQAAPSGPASPVSPPPTSGQFSAVGAIAGSVGPLSNSATYQDRYPANGPKSIVLASASIGGAFASGLPKYAMGEVITAPLIQADGVTPAAADYWRIRPVYPGEIVFTANANQTLIPLGSVTVTSATTSSSVISVSSVPAELTLGAMLLGQPVTNIVGNSISLGGNANATIGSPTASTITPALTYYYSPHAEKVFATQPGRVTVTWITRVPVSGANYAVKSETFAVSSTTKSPVRTIYWTEGSFDGPKVQITDGRITTVNPVFYGAVPKAVPEEVNIPGYNPASPNLTTLSFDKYNGLGQLHAYNVEGRIFVEYLGNVRLAGNIYEHVGFDVVDIKRVPSVNYTSVNLGQEIRPHDNDASLNPSPVLAGAQNAASFYGTNVRADNTSAYFAERTTSPEKQPDDGSPASTDAFNKVVFYWLETGSFSIRWPKFQDRYWLRWSPAISDYAHYTVDGGGSTPDTGIAFNSGTLPQLVFQDDPAQTEASIDLNSQRFHVNFSAGDLRNRSLLKFTNSSKVWYVNVYSQAEDRKVQVTGKSGTKGLLMSTFDSSYGLQLLAPISNLRNLTPSATATVTAPIDYTNFDLPGITNQDTFSVLWEGFFDVNEAGPGSYTFGTNSDDGSVIYLDLNGDGDFNDAGELVVNNNGVHGSLSATGTVNLPAGRVRIAIGFFEDSYGQNMNARWKKGAGLPFSQLDTIQGITGPFYPPAASATLAVSDASRLEVGMVLGGTGITIIRIVDSRTIELSDEIPADTLDLVFTLESDGAASIQGNAIVGTRLVPPAGHEFAGYISGGTGYHPAAYLNPFTVGVVAANKGAIIPVNALPGNEKLTVRWFKKAAAPSAGFSDFYVPGKVGRYTVTYPSITTPEIVIAKGVGTDDLPTAEAAGSVYYQNDSTKPGFNPNEEHAIMLGGRAYALRDDLNVTSGAGYTSEPFVLLAYTDPVDLRPAMHAYKVRRTAANYDFNYTATAGTMLVKPYPLPLLPTPLVASGTGYVSKDLEIIGADLPLNGTVSDTDAYKSFTFQDRKGFTWISRGPHQSGIGATGTGISQRAFTGGDIGEGLDLDGTFLYAVNIGTNAAPGQIRDADFTSDSAPGVTYSAANQINDWGSPSYGDTSNDDRLESMMKSIRWNTGSMSVDLANVIPGKQYKLQLLFHELGTARGFNVIVEGTTIVPNFIPGAIQGNDASRGALVSYEFTATDNTVNIVLDGTGSTATDKNPILGGLTLEVIPTLSMKLYYVSRDGFFIPGMASQPPAGTILPFLRQASRSGKPLNLATIDNGQIDEPLLISYRPAWPTQAAELRVAETLTLPKFGLPQVRGQSSAEILYQQSIANAPTATKLSKNSVTLHDPTREKTISLDTLAAIPASIATSDYQGKTYFQGLPPNLQQRIFIDPLRGPKGALVFIGEFHDEPAGEDYLDLNVLTASDEEALKGLAEQSDPDKTKWDAAIDALSTRVQTFMENPALAGDYIVDPALDKDVSRNSLAVVRSSETAVDSYALTATGQGTGYVTMVFGNGDAFTDSGDPVEVKVFKVAPQLYTGDLKVVLSSNPLDEQVALRHSGDFAGRPEDYDFEWRWTTGVASAPAVYTTNMTTRIGDSGWRIVSDPGTPRPTDEAYSAAGVLQLPRGINVRPDGYTAAEKAAGLPAVVLKSNIGADFTVGVPGEIVFSAITGNLDGLVLYVNGTVALAWQAPAGFPQTNAASGLASGALPRQWKVPASYFTAGPNTVEVAMFSGADPNVFSQVNFHLQAALETDAVVAGSIWQTPTDPTGKNTNLAVVGGSDLNPFGGPQFVINDRWFTMRYKPKAGTNNVLGSDTWSRWMPPQFVEGWVKRVLAAINPFEQRVKDLYNNEINTDVSVLTQAGTRWEGDVALNLDNVNNTGLIAIYETVLNRAKNISIDANTNDPDTNKALVLAAGYLNDLYTLLGNEAFADAANPTISIDDQNGAGQVNTSRFSFEGQVATSLDEELALLRGRDDIVSPGVSTAPAYNRLYWNYTHGINSGEAIYALNYNIREKAGSANANGVIDEYDAERMFPQGHGDAYGHYLTALTGYYKLLSNSNFTWTPRAEAVTVLGQPITVDYQDERKFAAAAGNLAHTAQQAVALTWRKSYKDDPAAGWDHLRDRRAANPQTGVTRRQGLDEWVSRSTQGALYHWAVVNSLLPAHDLVNTGIEQIDRTTVPEIAQLPAAADSFQTTIDSANARLNPLGLSPDAIAFDISPAELANGVSHYEQVSHRALTALNNAAGAFNQAAVMTGSLRNQEIGLDDFNTGIVEQERAFEDELVGVFGSPYPGDVGPGKLFAQDYSGPDLFHWFIVDRPNDLVTTGAKFSITLQEAVNFNAFSGDTLMNITGGLDNKTGVTSRTVTIQPSRYVQYNDVWKSGGLGTRGETGALQDALQDAQQSELAIADFKTSHLKDLANLRQAIVVFRDLVANHAAQLGEMDRNSTTVITLESVRVALGTISASLDAYAAAAESLGDTLAEFFPRSVGLATDATSGARGAAKAAGSISGTVLSVLSIASTAASDALGVGVIAEEKRLEAALTRLGFSNEELQAAYELSTAYRDHVSRSNELMQLTLEHQRALQNVENVLAEGNNILANRELFRQRAAAVVQGYRTRDVTFRLFRNEALEQYRSLFDLASRYSYLSAKSYDYETGLLGSTQGKTVFRDIVASRSLGNLTDGTPQLTTSSLGDAGLAGSMAKLNADFSVAKTRLGINNPDHGGTVFSMRGELFRIRTDASENSDNEAWQQTLEQHITANVMADPDVATYCRNIRKPDGTPVPGIVIPFSTTIQQSRNFFGLELAAGDHAYTSSNFATKIYSVGLVLPGYVGMDAYASGAGVAGAPASSAPNALSATPYVYLIPCGLDYMLAPPLGDTNIVRAWKVDDQALPLPFNLGANDFNSTQFFDANGTLSEKPWIIRKHQAFRPVNDPSLFYGEFPTEFTNSRLVGRSVWNGRWKLVIPAYTLLNNEQEGLNRFAASVQDIQLFLRTYSNSGN